MPSPTVTTSLHNTEEQLDQILAEISEKLQAGDSIDIEPYCRSHPSLADQLRAVIPAMRVLHELAATAPPAASSDSALPGILSAPESAHGDALGDFRLIREIGRGGMGIVYEAEQLSLHRRVAVKVLPLAGMLDQRALARFQNEARAAATLFHPHIVPVFFVGVERSVHFYAMQLIEGQSLAEAINGMRNAELGTRNEEGRSSNSELRIPHSKNPKLQIPNPKSTRTSSPPSPLTTPRTPSATSAASPSSASRPPRPSTTPTSTASSTATSSRPTSCSTTRARRGSPT